MKGFCGHLKDETKLKNCASGGFATALYEKILKNGGVGYGVAYTPDFKGAEYIRITKSEEIKKLQTSKYIKASLTEDIINKVTEDLKRDKEVVVIGLPCDVACLYEKLYNINKEKLLLVDLKCNGPATFDALTQYVELLEKRFESKVKNIITPFKNPTWYPVYIKVEFENNKEYVELLADTEFGVAFDFCKDENCYYCKYKGDNHKSDMTVSNFWGVNIKDPAFSYHGTSYAYVYTKKGEEALKSLDTFNLFENDANERNKSLPRYTTTPEKIKQYERFKKNFKKYGLLKAVKKQQTLKAKIKKLLKK